MTKSPCPPSSPRQFKVTGSEQEHPIAGLRACQGPSCPIVQLPAKAQTPKPTSRSAWSKTLVSPADLPPWNPCWSAAANCAIGLGAEQMVEWVSVLSRRRRDAARRPIARGQRLDGVPMKARRTRVRLRNGWDGWQDLNLRPPCLASGRPVVGSSTSKDGLVRQIPCWRNESSMSLSRSSGSPHLARRKSRRPRRPAARAARAPALGRGGRRRPYAADLARRIGAAEAAHAQLGSLATEPGAGGLAQASTAGS